MKVKGKTVVISGVSRGIGKALVDRYLELGAVVVGMGLRRPDLNHDNFHFFTTNVRDNAAVVRSFERMRQEVGAEIHIMINNAGLGYFDKIEDVDLDELHQMYETNVYPLFYTSKIVVPQMKKQQLGHIFNIASTAGIESYPQVSAYCGTKFAVKAISGSMYKELRDDRIKVTCIYPGSVKTDFFENTKNITAHDYMLMPQDVAEMIVWASQTPDNFHQVNLEVRPLQPKGPKKN